MNNLFYRSIGLATASTFLLVVICGFFSECIDDEPIKIQSIYPQIGCKRNSLSIIGWGFGDINDSAHVEINGIAAKITKHIPDMIVVTLPDTVTSGKITVQVGNKIITGPNYSITGPRYYIKFNVGVQLKDFNECDPHYGYGDGCTSCNVLGAELTVCNSTSSKFTASVIEGWKGHKFSFIDVNYPVRFDFSNDDGTSNSSVNADSQTDSELTITDVAEDPSVIKPNVYIVSGTFKCNVATSDGDDVTITNGEFSIRLNAPSN
jgi:hypothetical protein